VKILRFVIFFVILFLLFRFVFVLKTVDCVLEDNSLESGVCERLNQFFKGKSLFFTDFENEAIWDELMTDQQYGQVYQYQKINKHISGEVDLFLLAKLPDYRLVIGQERYLLNHGNKLKNDQDRLSLPSIEFLGDSSLIEHGYLEENYHQKFLSLSQALKKYEIETNKIVWQSNQEIHIFLKEIEVIMDDAKEFDYQVERLSLVLKEEELKDILPSKKILDMRFNLPVLRDSQ